MKPEKTIRWMLSKDMGNVLEIGREVYGYWFTEKVVTELVKPRYAIMLVCEVPHEEPGWFPETAGFVHYELKPDGILCTSMVVAERHRRKGVGTALLKKILSKRTPKRHTVRFDVPEVCMEMQLFLRANGIKAAHIYRDHFQWSQGEHVDGIIFESTRNTGAKV